MVNKKKLPMAVRVIAVTGGALLALWACSWVLLAASQPTSELAAPALLQRWRVGREALAQMPNPRRLPCLACLPKGVVEPDRKMGRAANKGRKGSTGWYICGKTNSGKNKRCYSSKKKRAKIPKRKEGRGMLQV
jgi:hypothetical protein